jgi:hypothetical protein
MRIRTGVALVAIPLVVACSSFPLGPDCCADMDGKLVDYGPFTIMGRYVMQVGTIGLGNEKERHFRVEGLPPSRDFVLQLELKAKDCEIRKLDLRVSLKMTEENGNVVIAETHALREMVWGGSANPCDSLSVAYVDGGYQTFHIGPGNNCNRPIITGADNGNGTWFVSRAGAVYSVTVSVHGNPADMRPDTSLRVVLHDIGGHSTTAHCP